MRLTEIQKKKLKNNFFTYTNTLIHSLSGISFIRNIPQSGATRKEFLKKKKKS
jgi:hypothetical protein